MSKANWGEGFVEVREGTSISVRHTPATDSTNSGDDVELIGLVKYSLPISHAGWGSLISNGA